MAKTDKNGPIHPYKPEMGRCWICKASLTHTGHTKIHIRNSTGGQSMFRCHRVSYEHFVGPIPVGMVVRHIRINQLARYFMQLDGSIAEAQRRWGEGNLQYMPDLPALPEEIAPSDALSASDEIVTPKEQPVSTAHHSGITISQAFERYAAERKPKPATVKGYRASVRRFVELIGDLDVGAITKRDIAAFKDDLLLFPKVLKSADRILTAPELIERYRDQPDVPRLSATTINAKHISGVSVSLQWASENGYIESVVSRGVRAKGPRSSEPKRLPYTIDELKALFALPVFMDGERPIGGAGEASVWLPILATYTGARLNELGTLAVSDVTNEAGIAIISIRYGKTEKARRKVPLHSEIIRLGFMDYVESRRAEGVKPDDPLFPFVRSNSDKEQTGPYSQWWGRYARKAVSGKRKSFHSFRHTTKRALRNANVSKTLRDAVMGHEADDIAEAYGLDEQGIGYEVATLQAAIEKIEYPGLRIKLGKPVRLRVR